MRPATTHLTGTITLVGDNTIEVDAGSLAIDGQVSGTGGLTKSGTGELTLTASNTYSGATMISAGTLDVTNSGALSTSAVTVDDYATLQLDGGITITPSSITVAGAGAAAAGALIAATGNNSYAGPITLAAGQTDIDVEAGATLDLSGDIGEDMLGRQLVSIGDGALILGGTGSYTSGASLLGGTTVVNGSIAASPSGVAIQSGATLAGTGTVNPTLFVFSGATVAPGDIGITGILDTGNASFVTGSTFHVRLDGPTAGTGYDQLNVTGTVNLDALTTGGATLDLDMMTTPAIGDTFTSSTTTAATRSWAPSTAWPRAPRSPTATSPSPSATPAARQRRRPHHHRRHLHLERPAAATTTGPTGANWVGDVVPTPAPRLVFPSGAARHHRPRRPRRRVRRLSRSTSMAPATRSAGNAIDLDDGIATTYASGTSPLRRPRPPVRSTTAVRHAAARLVLSARDLRLGLRADRRPASAPSSSAAPRPTRTTARRTSTPARCNWTTPPASPRSRATWSSATTSAPAPRWRSWSTTRSPTRPT